MKDRTMINRKFLPWLLALVLVLAPVIQVVQATDISSSTEYSETDASNNAATNPGWPENMAPSRVNDAARALQGAIKRFWDRVNGTLTSSGGSGVYALSYSVAPSTYVNGETFSFRANHTNGSTGGSLNINLLGVKTLVKPATNGLVALAASDIATANHVMVQYDSTADQFVIISHIPASAAASAGVTGPSSSVNNGIAVFSGTTGQIIADSATPYTSLKTQGTETLWIPAGAMIAAQVTGAAIGKIQTTTNFTTINTYDFDPSTIQYTHFNVGMPKSWNLGTVTAQFMWTAASGSGNIIWQLQCRSFADNANFDQAFGTVQGVTDTLLTANYNHITSTTPAITCAGPPAQGDLVLFRLYRDASNGGDTLATNGRLVGVRIYYTTNAANDN